MHTKLKMSAAPMIVLFLLGVIPCVSSALEKPNVILLLADDLGYGDLGAHGNPQLRTPNLDRLSRESTRFTDHHVAPMCSPTRGELMSGLSAFRNGASAVAQGRSVVRRGLSIMPQYFKDDGYVTAHFGKWHLGDSYPFRPHDRGFDFSVYTKGYGTSSISDYWQNDAFDDHFWRNGTLVQMDGYNTDVFFDQAMDWMRHQTGRFFVYLATTASHEPHYVDSSFEKPYEELDPALAAFYGMTANLDQNVGRLLSFLDETGLASNTILIYMTDNGTVERTNFYNAGMRGRKASLYEGGHRVPFFIRWPAGIGGEPHDVEVLTHSTDILPTLIDLAGLDVKRPTDFDGKSLVPLLEGRSHTLSDRKLVVQYGAEFEAWDSVVLWKDWRLVHGTELYDLSSDPAQTSNVASTYPRTVGKLRTHYESWLVPTKKMMGRKNYVVVGSPFEKVSTMSAADWVGPYCGEWGELEAGADPLLGHWNLEAHATDIYTISLFLFPPEANVALNEPFRTVPPRSVEKAKLTVNDEVFNAVAQPGASSVRFEVPLERGGKYRIEGKFLDSENQLIWGAVYLVVQPTPRG